MNQLRRYAPFFLALACGAAALGFALSLAPQLVVQLPANAFFLVYIVLEFVKFRHLTPAFLRRHAAITDEPAWLIVVG